MNATLRSLALLVLVTTSPAAFGQELIENVVVRNRLYETGGRLELGALVGFTLVSRLTDHINFNADIAYSFTDAWALELRGGYALSRHTGLADQVTEDVSGNSALATVDEFSNLWEMQANGVLGLRWSPIYGKISLLAELPVHFQAYLWLGGGVATFTRTSVMDCDAAGCFTEDKVGPLASAAFGFRFFVTKNVGIKVELRDYLYLDSYREKINANATPGSTGQDALSPGITNLVLINLGAQYIF